jgi:predicted Zn finger-like uncharacterized protein
MLKVDCESCKAPYQVDGRRVPPAGLKMRCPKCGHTFLVLDPTKDAGDPSAESTDLPSPTMIGLSPKSGVKAGAPSGMTGGVAPSPPPAVQAPFELAPAPSPSAPPVRRATESFPGLDDLDLPSLVGEARAPAPQKPRAPKPPAIPQRGAPSPPALAELPSIASGLPVGASSGLPTAVGAGGVPGLPSAVGMGGVPGLPTAVGMGGVPGLPTAVGMGGVPGLPSAVGMGGVGLPAPQTHSGLPATKGEFMGFGEIALPSVQNEVPLDLTGSGVGGPIGTTAAFGSPDLGTAGMLEMAVPPPFIGDSIRLSMRDSLSYGEADIPRAEAAATQLGVGPALGDASPDGAGLRGATAVIGSDAVASRRPSTLGFGEVDLGESSDAIAPAGPAPAARAGAFSVEEASLEAKPNGPMQSPTAAVRDAQRMYRPASKAPKVIGAALALLIAGGAVLQLTPLGAFGHIWIGDKLHAGEDLRVAIAKAEEARVKLAEDSFPVAMQAADDLAVARKALSRSKPLAAYAAFVEFMNQIRFGGDPTRSAKASASLADIPVDAPVPFASAARAAQAAQSGDWGKARDLIETALTKESNQGIQGELLLLKGEVALAQRDSAAALSAFSSADSLGSSPRSAFGLARAHVSVRALPKAREVVDAALKKSPSHAGLLTLRALLSWELDRDHASAEKEIASLLEESKRRSLGPTEVSFAFATRGTVAFARERIGEARVAFDNAVKADPRNVAALIGQGEVLFADGRFTEALTRYDEAASKEPANAFAIVGSAKSKISLERLADAKTQLVAARKQAPKEMALALWLARAEEALGNRKAADELYTTAVDLAESSNPDAAQPYASYAKFLASQGKLTEAAAKLDTARQKLPNNPALQRAFGDVAVAQGQFAQAVAFFLAALAKNPNDLAARLSLGVTYRRMHKLDLAAKALDEVEAIDKDYSSLALERGLLLEESGDIKRALEQFEGASKRAPNDLDLKLRVGAAYVAIGDIERALPLLMAVKDQRPNSAEANHYVGRAYLQRGALDSAQAMRFLQRAVALDPNKAEYHLYVAWAANEATPVQLGLARSHIDRALQLDSLLADGYWQRGVLLRKEGQVNDAIKDLKRALELKPTRFEAHAALAEAYEDRNERGPAMVEWQSAISGNSKPPYWRWKYGKLLADKGAILDAAKHLAYAVEQASDMKPRPGWLGPAAFEAAEALKKTGQKKTACDDYAIYLELAPPSDPDRRDALRSQKELGCLPER